MRAHPKKFIEYNIHEVKSDLVVFVIRGGACYQDFHKGTAFITYHEGGYKPPTRRARKTAY